MRGQELPRSHETPEEQVLNDIRLGHAELTNQISQVVKAIQSQPSTLAVPTADQAEKCGPYAACVNVIARVASKLSLRLVDEDGSPVQSALASALIGLWNGTALGPARMLAWIINQLFYTGNAYLYINTMDSEGNDRGSPQSLVPVIAHPVFKGLVLTGYRVRTPNNASKLVRIDEILHFTTERTNGVMGIPPREKESADEVALYIQLTRFANTSFDDDMMSRLAILDKAGALEEAGIRAIEKQFSQKYTGAKSRSRPLTLSGDYDLKELQYDLRKSQLSEVRKQVALNIIQTLGVPPTLVGMDTTQRVYGAGIREIIRSFYSLRMVGMFEIIAQEINRKLLPVGSPYSAHFDATRITELDRQELTDILIKEVGGAFKVPNEARQEAGIPESDVEVEGGDSLRASATATINMGGSNA